MQIKIFSFSDDVVALEKSINEWLNGDGKNVEIVTKTQTSVFDDYMKKVVVTITIWYNQQLEN